MGKSGPAEEAGTVLRLSAEPPTPTLAEAIRIGLADEITSGRLAPGTIIDEQEVADRFHASRTPVREALRELAAAGLVVIEPRRGSRVAILTVDRLSEMFELMAETEAMCVRLATYRMTPTEKMTLHAIHRRSQEAVQTSDIDRYDTANRDFHSAIYLGTHNGFLADHATSLRLRLAPFRRVQFVSSTRISSSFDEHQGIVDSILRGEAEQASQRMRAHILIASSILAGYMAEAASREEARSAP
jgi:DNA-binding GntR family transcriptional regulator